MADYSPVYANGVQPFTTTTSAAVTGGQTVINTGVDTVGPATADSVAAVGVAAHDAASGAKVTVWPFSGVVHEVAAAAASTVTAGQVVATGAAGTVKTIGATPAVGQNIGVALTTATAPNKARFLGK